MNDECPIHREFKPECEHCNPLPKPVFNLDWLIIFLMGFALLFGMIATKSFFAFFAAVLVVCFMSWFPWIHRKL